MPYARPREVRDTFKTLISQNGVVQQEVDAAANDAGRRHSEADNALTFQLENIAGRLYDLMDRDAFVKLASVSGAGDIGRKIDAARAAAVEAQEAYEAFVAVNGAKTEIDVQLKLKKAALTNLDIVLEEAKKSYATIGGKLDVVSTFATKYGAGAYSSRNCLQTEADAAYFSSKKGFPHLWALTFDAHYREGRAVLRHYAKLGTTPAALWAEEKAHVAIYEPKYSDRTQLEGEIKQLTATATEIDRLSKQIASEADIRRTMLAEIVKQLDDKTTFSRAAVVLPEYVSDAVVEARVKADAFQRVQERLVAQSAGLDKMSANLNKHMYKLDRAVSRAPSKDIKIDLPDIARKYQGQQVLNRHLAQEAVKANARIGAFSTTSPRVQMRRANDNINTTSSTYDPLDVWTMYMIWSLLDTNSLAGAVDPAAVQMTLGIPEAAALAADIDMANLSPNIDVASLNELNGMNIDAGNLDSLMSDINISIPDISVPDISVPDISIDTGSVGGFDGGGGGFDGGGGW